MNELELIDESRPSPSKYSDGGDWAGKGPITWNMLYQIDIRFRDLRRQPQLSSSLRPKLPTARIGFNRYGLG